MTFPLDDQQISAVADMFHLLGDPTRLKIVYACLDDMRSAGDIAADVGASASLVSHHLRLLKTARLVRSERRGRQVLTIRAELQRVNSAFMAFVAPQAQGRPELAAQANPGPLVPDL